MQRYTSRNIGENKNTLSLKAKWGIVLVICAMFLLFSIITNILPFIRSFILGAIGLSAYPIILVAGLVGVLLIRGKNYTIAKNYLFSMITLYFILICIFHTGFTDLTNPSFSDYLTSMYNIKITPGGVLAGVFVYLISSIVNYVGTFIVFAILGIISIAFMFDYYLRLKEYKKINSRAVSYAIPESENKILSVKKPAEKKRIFGNAFRSRERGSDSEENAFASNELQEDDAVTNDSIVEQIFGSEFAKSNNEEFNDITNEEQNYTIDDFINKAKANSFENFAKNNNIQKSSANSKDEKNDFVFNTNFSSQENINWANLTQPKKNTFDAPSFKTNLELDDLSYKDDEKENSRESEQLMISDLDDIIGGLKTEGNINNIIQPIQKPTEIKQMEMPITNPTPLPTTPYTPPSPYVRPSITLLTTQSSKMTENEADFKINAETLEETLESFKISAIVESVVQGPAVTRYEIKMPAGVSVNKIKQHADDIAMMLKSVGGVRIEAPIPGKNLVGIELPNKKIATIGLKDVLDSPDFHNTKSALPFILGKNISGSIKICDLASMPHLLVAGSTGSGKSVCLNILIVSLLYKMGPDDLKLILIDPKRVEFSSFNGLPHLSTIEAICQPKQALNAFDWAIAEMDKRFNDFKQLKVRNFEEYNSLKDVYNHKKPKLPRIVIIVDELADLMMFGKKDLEDKIMRIAQLARAAGIHLVLATQRPSVDVITGTIKANLPSRIAFALNSYQDSMTILNQGGAEKLLGKGDMLYFPQNLPEPVRIQCPYLSNEEVKSIVDYIIKNNNTPPDMQLADQILNGKGTKANSSSGDEEGEGIEYDPILPKALYDFIKSGNASISSIQRRYAVGYARAARIVDQMESNGFISPADSTNKRKVLIDEEKYNEIFSNSI